MLKTVVSTLGLALAACSVGSVNGGGDDVPTDGSGGNDPRAGTFATEVLPLVMGKTCTDANCHGGVQTPKLTSFTLMTENSVLAAKYLKLPATDNIIINKDTVSGTPGMHQGRPYLTQTEKDSISAWLATGP